jgi:hypothetical protein
VAQEACVKYVRNLSTSGGLFSRREDEGVK